MMVQPPQEHSQGKYDNNGKGSYFRFEYVLDTLARIYPTSIYARLQNLSQYVFNESE